MVRKRDRMKNRIIKVMAILIFCFIMTTACGQKRAADPDMGLFIGEWACEEHPLENETYYTGFIMMDIQEDGSFRMFDAEAGNPVISGDLSLLSKQELVFRCSTEEDFDPPPTWQSMNEEQKMAYSFSENGNLHLTYQEGEAASTLVFVKQ